MRDDDKPSAPTKTHKDYYYILGVRPNATTQEILEAYNELYEKFGPHIAAHSLDPEIQARTFKDITDAYDVLMNPAKRKEYDKVSEASRQTSDVRALWGKVTKDKKATIDASKPKPAEEQVQIQAQALEMEIEVSLKEAVKGTRKQIIITDPTPCEYCADKKPLERMQCEACRGLGYFNVDRTAEFDFPPGICNNMEIRKPGQGRWDLRAGKYGDLIFKMRLREHPVLKVLGKEIKCIVPVTIYEAMLGADIQVPTATGKVSMKIQPLTQQGRLYRLKGLGLAGADMLVVIDVVIPKKLSGEEVKLYRRLQELSQEPNPRNAMYEKIDHLP
jgi:DnaJ-class molecular chaperone